MALPLLEEEAATLAANENFIRGYVTRAVPGVDRARAVVVHDAAAGLPENVVQFPRAMQPRLRAEPKSDVKGMALNLAASTASLMAPGVALPVALVAGQWSGNHQANKAMEELRRDFGAEAAEAVGVSESDMTPEQFEEWVKKHHALDEQRVLSMHEKHTGGLAAVAKTAGALAGTAAAGAAIGAATLAGVIALPAFVAGGLTLAAGAAGTYAVKTVLNAVDRTIPASETAVAAIRTLADKRERGEAVDPEDVFGVLVRSNPALKEKLEKRFSTYPTKPFEDLTDEEKTKFKEVMNHFGDVSKLSANLAGMINQGQMAPLALAQLNLNQALGMESVKIAGGQRAIEQTATPAAIEQTTIPLAINPAAKPGFVQMVNARRQVANNNVTTVA